MAHSVCERRYCITKNNNWLVFVCLCMVPREAKQRDKHNVDAISFTKSRYDTSMVLLEDARRTPNGVLGSLRGINHCPRFHIFAQNTSVHHGRRKISLDESLDGCAGTLVAFQTTPHKTFLAWAGRISGNCSASASNSSCNFFYAWNQDSRNKAEKNKFMTDWVFSWENKNYVVATLPYSKFHQGT